MILTRHIILRMNILQTHRTRPDHWNIAQRKSEVICFIDLMNSSRSRAAGQSLKPVAIAGRAALMLRLPWVLPTTVVLSDGFGFPAFAAKSIRQLGRSGQSPGQSLLSRLELDAHSVDVYDLS